MDNSLSYKTYIGTVEFSADDEVFYGKLQGINDLVTFEGTSVKELKKAFVEAVDDYLKTCAETNKQPDKAYKGSFNVRLSEDLHKKAALLAAKQQVTLNEYVKKALFYAVSHPNVIGKASL